MRREGKSELGRRRFFLDAVGRMVSPLADFLERQVEARKPPARLRPPGALEEFEFLRTCYRCGSCVETCPVGAIIRLGDGEGEASRTPVIDPDLGACVVCEGLQCTHTCPSGALRPLSDPSEIAIGTAVVYAPVCVRSAGEECTECVAQCPIGESAIRFIDTGPPDVRKDGCVGCGVCQLHCPTRPKAIVVQPRR
jgi:ferredoxin-type protein NapG